MGDASGGPDVGSEMIPPRPDLGGPPVGQAPAATSALPPLDEVKVSWSWWEAILVVLAGFMAQGIIIGVLLQAFGVPADRVGPPGAAELLANGLANVLLVGGLVWWLTWRHPGWVRMLGFPPQGLRIKEALVGGGTGLVVRFASAIVAAIVIALMSTATGSDVALPQQVETPQGAAPSIVLILFVVVIAPITEELIFRGLIYRGIRDRFGIVAGVAASSLLFGLVHFVEAPWQEVLSLQIIMVGTGVGLALIYEWRRNLLAPIAGHLAFNLLSVVFIISGWG